MASHNDLQDRAHISAFPDQAAITAFLRALLGNGRTQVTWANDSKIPYNTLTNWFTKKPPLMSAEAFLALVMSANAEDRLVKQIQEWRAASGEVPRPHAVNGNAPVSHRRVAEPKPLPEAPVVRRIKGPKRSDEKKGRG